MMQTEQAAEAAAEDLRGEGAVRGMVKPQLLACDWVAEQLLCEGAVSGTESLQLCAGALSSERVA